MYMLLQLSRSAFRDQYYSCSLDQESSSAEILSYRCNFSQSVIQLHTEVAVQVACGHSTQSSYESKTQRGSCVKARQKGGTEGVQQALDLKSSHYTENCGQSSSISVVCYYHTPIHCGPVKA